MQHQMIAHMLDVPRCAVWAGMGSGKTRATLEALHGLWLLGEINRVLVIGPLRVAQSVWPDEANLWTPEFPCDFIGGKDREAVICASTAPVHSIHYEWLPWLVEFYGDQWPYDAIVSDESTRLRGYRLKGHGGKRTAALGKVSPLARRFVELTGTPAPNGYSGLWGQMWFLDAGVRLERTYGMFKHRWFQKSDNGHGLDPLAHAMDDINAQLEDLCVTIDPRDYMTVREPIVTPIYVELPPKARALYRDMEKEMFMQLGEHDVEAFNAAARTNKCLQLANGAAYVDDTGAWREVHDAKLEALDSILEDANGMPVLCAYQFRSDLARILKRFGKMARELDKKPSTIVDWNAGRIPLLVAHPASAGHGLSLQHGGNILAIFGQTWDLEHYLQMVERIGPLRQLQSGYDRPVYIYPIIARRTVDELVMRRRETKKTVQDILLEHMKRAA